MCAWRPKNNAASRECDCNEMRVKIRVPSKAAAATSSFWTKRGEKRQRFVSRVGRFGANGPENPLFGSATEKSRVFLDPAGFCCGRKFVKRERAGTKVGPGRPTLRPQERDVPTSAEEIDD